MQKLGHVCADALGVKFADEALVAGAGRVEDSKVKVTGLSACVGDPRWHRGSRRLPVAPR
jgi:hypothetical protein